MPIQPAICQLRVMASMAGTVSLMHDYRVPIMRCLFDRSSISQGERCSRVASCQLFQYGHHRLRDSCTLLPAIHTAGLPEADRCMWNVCLTRLPSMLHQASVPSLHATRPADRPKSYQVLSHLLGSICSILSIKAGWVSGEFCRDSKLSRLPSHLPQPSLQTR
jgi:hypothetical protein